MTNVLVTGASGFIGKPLIARLLQSGYFVRAASRSKPLINIIKNTDNYEWQYYDLTSIDINYDSLLKDIDIVIHLAAQVHIMDGISGDILDGYRIVNTRATEILADESSSRGIKRFIFLSTIKVNGEGSNNRVMSVTDIPNPQDPYAVSKHDAEIAIRKIGDEGEMDYAILRPPLVYGPGVRANFLRLLKIISLRYPLPLAAINNRRSLIYVYNLVDLIFSFIKLETTVKKVYLVKDIDISTPDLLRAIARSFGHHITLIPVPLFLLKIAGLILGKKSIIDRLTDSLVIDDSPTRDELDWAPLYGLDEGLKATANWYKEYHLK